VPSVQRAKAAAAGVKKTTKAKPVLPPVFVPKAAAAPGAVQPLRTAKVPLRLPRPVIAPVTTTLRSLDHVVSPSLNVAWYSLADHPATRVCRCKIGTPAPSAPPRLIALPTLPPTQSRCALADYDNLDQHDGSTPADYGFRYPPAR
jgi:hypothetical protein